MQPEVNYFALHKKAGVSTNELPDNNISNE